MTYVILGPSLSSFLEQLSIIIRSYAHIILFTLRLGKLIQLF